MNTQITPTAEILAELINESLAEYNIDFGMLQVSEDNVVDLMALSVLDIYERVKNDPTKDLMLMTSIGTLLVENFVLELKNQLREREN